jgi:hypothetical protein
VAGGEDSSLRVVGECEVVERWWWWSKKRIVVVRMVFVFRVRSEGEKRARDLLCGTSEVSCALLCGGPVACVFRCQ